MSDNILKTRQERIKAEKKQARISLLKKIAGYTLLVGLKKLFTSLFSFFTKDA